jgi:hypothetical protein
MVARVEPASDGGNRLRRLAENENLFRDVNERIREVGEAFEVRRTQLSRFVCECDDPTCTTGIELTPAEYERIRQRATHFFVAKGHDDPEAERVVEEADAYDVVEKHPGAGAEAARAADPRA